MRMRKCGTLQECVVISRYGLYLQVKGQSITLLFLCLVRVMVHSHHIGLYVDLCAYVLLVSSFIARFSVRKS